MIFTCSTRQRERIPELSPGPTTLDNQNTDFPGFCICSSLTLYWEKLHCSAQPSGCCNETGLSPQQNDLVSTTSIWWTKIVYLRPWYTVTRTGTHVEGRTTEWRKTQPTNTISTAQWRLLHHKQRKCSLLEEQQETRLVKSVCNALSLSGWNRHPRRQQKQFSQGQTFLPR